MRPAKIITVDPREGKDLSVVGDNYRLLITGKETENAFAVIDSSYHRAVDLVLMHMQLSRSHSM